MLKRSRRVLIFFKHDKRRMRAQEQGFIRSVVLDPNDVGLGVASWLIVVNDPLSLATDGDYAFSLLFTLLQKPLSRSLKKYCQVARTPFFT